MKSLVIPAAFAAFAVFAVPASTTSAQAQTVVVKRGHGHTHVHHPVRKKVVIVNRGRHLGWRNHRHWNHGQQHHTHRRGSTVGISIR